MSIDREKILKQLAQVMNQAAENGENVSQHRKTATELERDGQDASLARIMLIYAEHVQTMNLAERHRLEKMLGETIDGRERVEG